MTDLSLTIESSADQLTADDLIGGPKTITVAKVKGGGSKEQPISIFYEGDGGKPFKPCKTMRRLLVAVWKGDGAEYVGRRMTLWRDPEVSYGGVKTGGVRISHIEGVTEKTTYNFTKTQGKKAPVSVLPLKAAITKSEPVKFSMAAYAKSVEKILAESETADELSERWDRMSDWRKQAVQTDRDAATALRESVEAKIAELGS